MGACHDRDLNPGAADYEPSALLLRNLALVIITVRLI